MDRVLDIREISIVILAKNHNPTVLNPDFLKDNDIVPKDWELAEPPLCAHLIAQVKFKNGISIATQPEQVIFSESTDNVRLEKVGIPRIACGYITTLPHVYYTAVGINLTGHVLYPEGQGSPEKYVVEKLISPGPWREVAPGAASASVKLTYFYEWGQCSLTVEPTKFKDPSGDFVPAVRFSGNFHRDLVGETRADKLRNLQEFIREHEDYLQIYREIVTKRFLKGESNQ